jgi:hypothetical protein
MPAEEKKQEIFEWIHKHSFKILATGTLLVGGYFTWRYLSRPQAEKPVPSSPKIHPPDSPMVPLQRTDSAPFLSISTTSPKMGDKKLEIRPRRLSKTAKFLEFDMLPPKRPSVPLVDITDLLEKQSPPKPTNLQTQGNYKCTYYDMIYLDKLQGDSDEDKFTLRNEEGDFLSISSEMCGDGSLQEYFDSQDIPKNIKITTKRGTFLGYQGLLGYIYDDGELKTYQFYVMCYHRVFLFYSNQKLDKIHNEWIRKFNFLEPDLHYKLYFQSDYGFRVLIPSNFYHDPRPGSILYISRVIADDLESFTIQKKPIDISKLQLENTIQNNKIYSGRIGYATTLRVGIVEYEGETWYFSTETKIDNQKNYIQEALESIEFREYKVEQIDFQDIDTRFGIYLPQCLILKDDADIMFYFGTELRFEIRKAKEEKKEMDKIKISMLDEIESMECSVLTSYEVLGQHYEILFVEYKDDDAYEDLTYVMAGIVSDKGHYEAIGVFPTEKKDLYLQQLKELVYTIYPLK